MAFMPTVNLGTMRAEVRDLRRYLGYLPKSAAHRAQLERRLEEAQRALASAEGESAGALASERDLLKTKKAQLQTLLDQVTAALGNVVGHAPGLQAEHDRLTTQIGHLTTRIAEIDGLLRAGNHAVPQGRLADAERALAQQEKKPARSALATNAASIPDGARVFVTNSIGRATLRPATAHGGGEFSIASNAEADRKSMAWNMTQTRASKPKAAPARRVTARNAAPPAPKPKADRVTAQYAEPRPYFEQAEEPTEKKPPLAASAAPRTPTGGPRGQFAEPTPYWKPKP